MEIAFDRAFDYQELQDFLEAQHPNREVLLVYEGITDWEDARAGQAKFEYFEDKEAEEGFKFGLIVLVESTAALPLIERLASQLSRHFRCPTMCDASRVILYDQNEFYSLLFEHGKVFLVDNYRQENGGDDFKVVELHYEEPA